MPAIHGVLKAIGFAVLLSVVTAKAIRGQGPEFRIAPGIVVFERANAPGKLDVNKLRESLKLTMQELHKAEEALPGIAVFHISDSDAEALGVKVTSVWRTWRDGGYRYELWIVGEPTDDALGGLAEIFLERHFGIALEEVERKRLMRAVKDNLAHSVSEEELARNKLGRRRSAVFAERRN